MYTKKLQPMELKGTRQGVCEELYLALLDKVQSVARRIAPEDHAFMLFDLARQGKLAGEQNTELNGILLALEMEYKRRAPKGYVFELISQGRELVAHIIKQGDAAQAPLPTLQMNAAPEQRVTEDECYNKLLKLFGGDVAYLNRCLQRAATL